MSETQTSPTIGNMPGADLPVTFPSGETRTVNMIVLLAETQMSEQMARFGQCQAQNMRTIAELVSKYELDWFASEVFPRGVKTWKQCAEAMRHIYGVFSDHIDGVS